MLVKYAFIGWKEGTMSKLVVDWRLRRLMVPQGLSQYTDSSVNYSIHTVCKVTEYGFECDNLPIPITDLRVNSTKAENSLVTEQKLCVCASETKQN